MPGRLGMPAVAAARFRWERIVPVSRCESARRRLLEAAAEAQHDAVLLHEVVEVLSASTGSGSSGVGAVRDAWARHKQPRAAVTLPESQGHHKGSC